MNTSTVSMDTMAGMVGWDGVFPAGERPAGIHPWALIGAPPESRKWVVGDPVFAPFIDSSALVDAFCTVDAGTEYPTTVGARSWLQKRVHVGHDTVIGWDCEICVGVVICGHVYVGNGVRIGGNSWIKPRVVIGAGAIIGGGSVVTKDIPSHEVWAGNPARFLKLADTHPALFGETKKSRLSQHPCTIRFPTEAELAEWQREAAQSQGHGFGVDGDHA